MIPERLGTGEEVKEEEFSIAQGLFEGSIAEPLVDNSYTTITGPEFEPTQLTLLRRRSESDLGINAIVEDGGANVNQVDKQKEYEELIDGLDLTEDQPYKDDDYDYEENRVRGGEDDDDFTSEDEVFKKCSLIQP